MNNVSAYGIQIGAIHVLNTVNFIINFLISVLSQLYITFWLVSIALYIKRSCYCLYFKIHFRFYFKKFLFMYNFCVSKLKFYM